MDQPTVAATPDWVPVGACTLPTAHRPLRVAEFDDLFSAALRGVHRRPDVATRARLVLGGNGGLRDRVQSLVDAETACCSFFSFTLTALPPDAAGGPDQVRLALDIEVPDARADVLAGLVARAERALGAVA